MSTLSENSVSVWFTHPAEGEYRTWFICGQCRRHLHAINREIPPHYSEDRVSEQLENFDERALSGMRFKKPVLKKAAPASRPKEKED